MNRRSTLCAGASLIVVATTPQDAYCDDWAHT